MVAAGSAAERANPVGVRYVHADGLGLPFGDDSFDFSTAFMSLMDTGAPEGALREISRVVHTGGFVQLSVPHPAATAEVDRYFDEGAVTESWLFGAAPTSVRSGHRPFTIRSQRRTMAGWVSAVTEAGLVVEELTEPRPSRAVVDQHPRLARARNRPYFLHIRARTCAP